MKAKKRVNIFSKKWSRLFRRKTHTLPPKATCRNCGTKMRGIYCHSCGQKYFAGTSKSVFFFLTTAIDSIFSIDSKIFITLKYLLFYPGRLTADYVEGKIVRYVHPSKLFWLTSLFFFAYINYYVLNPDIVSADHKDDGKRTALVDTTSFDFYAQKADSIKIDSLKQHADTTDKARLIPIHSMREISKIENSDDRLEYFANSIIGEGPNSTISDARDVVRSFLTTYTPYVVFLLIPFFAFLLYLFFRKKIPYYADNMVFAIHFHTFGYICIGVGIFIGSFLGNYKSLINLVFVLSSFVYFVLAVKRFYKPTAWQRVLKIFSIFVIYTAALIAAMAILMLLMIVILLKVDSNEFFE